MIQKHIKLILKKKKMERNFTAFYVVFRSMVAVII
jgi:hypothetical protein